MNRNRNQLRNDLFEAIEEGNLNRVRYLSNLVNLNTTRDRYNRTPLAKAIEMVRPNVVRLLLQKGARARRNDLRFILRYMNNPANNNYTINNRIIKNIIINALGRQARLWGAMTSLRAGVPRRRAERILTSPAGLLHSPLNLNVIREISRHLTAKRRN